MSTLVGRRQGRLDLFDCTHVVEANELIYEKLKTREKRMQVTDLSKEGRQYHRPRFKKISRK